MKLCFCYVILPFTLAVLFTTSLLGADQSAAICDGEPSRRLAFVGTVLEVNSAREISGLVPVTFRVDELLQGEAPSPVTLLMLGGICGTGKTPKVAGTYLVLTSTYPKGGIGQLERCSQVRPVEQATADIQYLRNSEKGITPTEIAGEARVETRGYPWRRLPLPRTKIQLVGSDKPLEFVADEEGRFRGVVVPGKYEVKSEFPKGYEAEYCGPAAVILVEHRCAQIAVCGRPTGSITADLVDVDGQAFTVMSNVQLTLAAADDNQFVQSVWPDQESNLRAEGLLPGKYVLGLNTYLPVNNSSAPYPPTYYPGVSARSEAQVITLEPGEQKTLPEMRVKKGQGCDIPVATLDMIGKPSPLTTVSLAYPDYPNFWQDPNGRTDETGKGRVFAVFPGHVLLRAEIQNSDGSRVLSGIAEVESCPKEPIVLRLNHTVPADSESRH